ncbi:hypothetical protein A8B98_07080 [Hymenobacter sp. UV11]|nr:hypothetical protein A8B98_07080 [Hymenobacter sp. UV11]
MRKGRYQQPASRPASFAPTNRSAPRSASGLGWWVDQLAQLLDNLTGIAGFLSCVVWGIMLLYRAESVLLCLTKKLIARTKAWALGHSEQQLPHGCPC